LLIAYLDEHEDAKQTQRLVEEAGRTAVLVAGDIQNSAHCRTIVDRAASEFGQLDSL
jgi:NAD(P)-dependent dehydrogenase (short-subunit alcohol dehydrogenase family)